MNYALQIKNYIVIKTDGVQLIVDYLVSIYLNCLLIVIQYDCC